MTKIKKTKGIDSSTMGVNERLYKHTRCYDEDKESKELSRKLGVWNKKFWMREAWWVKRISRQKWI